MVVVVMGCHRGGSSLAADVLRALGVDMGQRFSPSNAINPYGYWEDLDFHDMNRRILKAAGGSWYDPPDENRLMTYTMPRFGQEIKELIRRKSRRSTLWGWKDPRTVLTWTFYEYWVNEPVKLVRAIRDREDICRSLDKWYHHLHVNWPGLVDYYGDAIAYNMLTVPSWDRYRLRFEDMVTESKAPRIVAGLAAWLGVDLDRVPAALNRIHFRRR
jgi:hypothetical protein